MDNFKVKKQEERKIILIGKCPFCERKVGGTTHSQLDWNLSLHIKQRHSDNEEAQILLKQIEEQNKARKEK
jgi:hypothetical protein